MPRPIPCPQCGQTDPVGKVSALYVAGLPDRKEGARHIPSGEQQRLSRRLAPPSGGKRQVTRPVHPDWMAGALGLILPIFLAGIYTQQRPLFWPSLGFLALLAALYFWQRPRLIRRFTEAQARQQDEVDNVGRAIQRWMRLYYCAACDIVFDPARKDPIPADQMLYHLMQR